MAGLPPVLRYAAFSDDPDGGNRAGVVLDAEGMSADQMQQVAADVGYSETAFLTGPFEFDATTPIRYFAPQGEVDFCGHATIATAAAIRQHLGAGTLVLATAAGDVDITAGGGPSHPIGTFRSVEVTSRSLESPDLDALLEILAWSRGDLDPELSPGVGFGGNLHPILVARDVARLDVLAYDFAALRDLCRARRWVTVHLTAATGERSWSAREPFPYGGVVEDPATGAAAAAFAGYLRDRGRVRTGDAFTVSQGVAMGRPSRVDVEVLDRAALVSGPAVRVHE